MKKMMKILVVFGFVMINSYAHSTANVLFKFPNKSFRFRHRKNNTEMANKWVTVENKPIIDRGTTEQFVPDLKNHDLPKNRYQIDGCINNKKVYISANPKIFSGHSDWKWVFDEKGDYLLYFLGSTGDYTLKETIKVIKKSNCDNK
jgi:hypothetical protein